MAKASTLPRLTDIVEAIAYIRSETADVSHEVFDADWRKLWLAERGLEIISEASRYLPDDLKARHPRIPWRKVAAIGSPQAEPGHPSVGAEIRAHRHWTADSRIAWHVEP